MLRLLRFFPTHWWRPAAWKTWWTYVHWRLETYGVYYPQGRFNGKAFAALLKQIPSYNSWLKDLDHLKR